MKWLRDLELAVSVIEEMIGLGERYDMPVHRDQPIPVPTASTPVSGLPVTAGGEPTIKNAFFPPKRTTPSGNHTYDRADFVGLRTDIAIVAPALSPSEPIAPKNSAGAVAPTPATTLSYYVCDHSQRSDRQDCPECARINGRGL